MIMVNGQWWMVNSIETIKQIISENLGQELADEMDKYMSEHSDEEYNDLVIENIELEDKVCNLEEEIDSLETQIESLEERIDELLDELAEM